MCMNFYIWFENYDIRPRNLQKSGVLADAKRTLKMLNIINLDIPWWLNSSQKIKKKKSAYYGVYT